MHDGEDAETYPAYHKSSPAAFFPREISAQVGFDLADLLPFAKRLGRFENLGLCKFRRRHGNASFLMEMRNLSLVSL